MMRFFLKRQAKKAWGYWTPAPSTTKATAKHTTIIAENCFGAASTVLLNAETVFNGCFSDRDADFRPVEWPGTLLGIAPPKLVLTVSSCLISDVSFQILMACRSISRGNAAMGRRGSKIGKRNTGGLNIKALVAFIPRNGGVWVVVFIDVKMGISSVGFLVDDHDRCGSKKRSRARTQDNCLFCSNKKRCAVSCLHCWQCSGRRRTAQQ